SVNRESSNAFATNPPPDARCHYAGVVAERMALNPDHGKGRNAPRDLPLHIQHQGAACGWIGRNPRARYACSRGEPDTGIPKAGAAVSNAYPRFSPKFR